MRKSIKILFALVAGSMGVRLRGRAIGDGDCDEQPSVDDLSVSFEDHPVGAPYLDAKKALDEFNSELEKLGTMPGPNWAASRAHSYDEAFGSSA